MLNKNNLSIRTLCEDKVISGHDCNKLYVTENSTFVVNRVYAVAVSSSLRISNTVGYIPEDGKPRPLPNVPPLQEMLDAEKVRPVIFEIKMDLPYLQRLIQSALDFEGEIVRIRFTGDANAVQMDCRNNTGQKWEALLMPRFPQLAEDQERYAEPAPEMSDYERAVLAAAELGTL